MFHTPPELPAGFAFLSAAIPLACGYPEPAVAPTLPQAALLLAIACGSFGGNLLVNRAFQLEPGARASAINFSQAGCRLPAQAWTLLAWLG